MRPPHTRSTDPPHHCEYHNRFACAFYMALVFLSPAGCTSSHLDRPFSTPPGVHLPQSAGDLLQGAASSGSLAPMSWVSGLFLLAAIPGYFLLSKRRFVGLLVVGVGLALLPVVVLAVMDHLVIPVAIGVGILGLGGLLFFLGRLWDRFIMRGRCRKNADIILSKTHPETMSDIEVADMLLGITSRKESFKETSDG